MRRMYDSISPENWPSDGDLYAGYVGGAWPTYTNGTAAAHAHGKPVVSIAVASTFDALVLDVEKGDAPPELAPGWVQRQRDQGVDPTVYCEAFALPSVRAAFQTAKVAEPWYWIAAYSMATPAVFRMAPTVVAHQFGGDRGAGWDISAVADHWPSIDPPEDDMYTDDDRKRDVEIHDMLTLLTKGADGFGVEPTPVAVTETHKLVKEIATAHGISD